MIPKPFDRRLALLRGAMRETGVGAYLCDHAEMLQWLTGYTVSETFYRGCVVPLDGPPVWVLRAIDELPCRAATWVPTVQVYADHQDAHGAVAGALLDTGAQAVGADFGSFGFTARTRDRLAALLPGVRFVDMPGSADLLRSVKDALEVGRIEHASEIADGAMVAIARSLRAGMRPRDASAIASRHYLTRGADDYWVGPISVSRRAEGQGHDMGFLHAVLRDDRLAEGDVLHVELVPRVAGYSARVMRSIRLGAPTAEEIATMERIRALQDAQISAMVPGGIAREIDALLRQPMLDEGLRAGFPNITGYQLGLYAKTPRSSDTSLSFHPGADWRLEAGQVFHMYATARGLALSETVLVTPSGGRTLTRLPRRILEAGEAVAPALSA